MKGTVDKHPRVNAKPTPAQVDILDALYNGAILRIHTCPEGADPHSYRKAAFLSNGPEEFRVARSTIRAMVKRGWLEEDAMGGDLRYRITLAGREQAAD